MRVRRALLVCCLALASCSSDTTEISDPTNPDPVQDATAAPTSTPAPTPTPEPATPEPSTAEPTVDDPAETDSTPYEELAAVLAETDFALDSTEELCVATGLESQLSPEQIMELQARSNENLLPDDPLTDSVVVVYETLGTCMGAERLLNLFLEPDVDPEPLACVVAAFPTEQEQIDAMVAVMTIELADLPEAPGRYKTIFDELEAACGPGAL